MNDPLLISAFVVVVLIVVGIIAVLLVLKKKKEGKQVEPDYRTFFILGICFLPLGISLMITVSPAFIGFFGLGVIYMIIGLTNQDKWKNKK